MSRLPYIKEKVAEAIYNATFVDEYQDLPINDSIEREVARNQAQAAIDAIHKITKIKVE